MNRALIRRWITEYLDGEIGLADKAELERLMAQDPEIRNEYRELRQIGLMLGSMPEVTVHSHRFRQRVADALDDGERSYFTPQRAFSAAMLVVLGVIALSFTMFIYRENVISSAPQAPALEASRPAVLQGYRVSLHTSSSCENFLSRVLVENQLGMLDPSVMGTILAQTRVFDGSTCSGTDLLRPVRFAQAMPRKMTLVVTPAVATQMRQVAEELSGRNLPFNVASPDGTRVTFEEYLKVCGTGPLSLELHFR
jgi:hypothetical protein